MPCRLRSRGPPARPRIARWSARSCGPMRPRVSARLVADTAARPGALTALQEVRDHRLVGVRLRRPRRHQHVPLAMRPDRSTASIQFAPHAAAALTSPHTAARRATPCITTPARSARWRPRRARESPARLARLCPAGPAAPDQHTRVAHSAASQGIGTPAGPAQQAPNALSSSAAGTSFRPHPPTNRAGQAAADRPRRIDSRLIHSLHQRA